MHQSQSSRTNFEIGHRLPCVHFQIIDTRLPRNNAVLKMECHFRYYIKKQSVACSVWTEGVRRHQELPLGSPQLPPPSSTRHNVCASDNMPTGS